MQGTIQVYRAESEIPAAFQQLPSELGIPLVSSGNVWRGKSRFRGDYTSEIHGDTHGKVVQSLAMDDGTVFRLSGGPDVEIGTLYVCDVGTPEAVKIENHIESQFYDRLDSLWSTGGLVYIDLLQRPGAKIAATSRTLQAGISLLVPFDDGTDAQLELEGTRYYPFGYSIWASTAGHMTIRGESRTFSREVDGRVLPTRIVTVGSVGAGEGYTEVVILDLKPLEADSPIAKPITVASFQDLGVAYQVYRHRLGDAEVEIAERYDTLPGAGGAGSGGVFGGFRTAFLWINGLVILTAAGYVAIRFAKKR
ncbi:MAG: hypothetical protein EA424_28320 [Planctomycetaceae bacterium]|nr:MAG: hypothetical protein EA424_28320 [Planctomycetaceae bacterium]